MSIEIPPFNRIIWGEDGEKNIQVFEQEAEEFEQAEFLTVAHKLRDCSTSYINLDNVQEEVSKLNQIGLLFWPIKRIERGSDFVNRFYEPLPGNGKSFPIIYGVISFSFEKAQEFVHASRGDNPDHTRIGQLLGYPSCCIKFFNKHFKRGEFDPIFSEAKKSEGAKIENGLASNIKGIPPANVKARIVTVKAIPEVNIALRYFGVRAIPHLPCSFTCQKSREFAKKFLEFMPSREKILEFLAEPMTWDGYKGVAVINTKWFQGAVNSVSFDDDFHRVVNFV